ALLLGYGAGAVNPYLAFETLDDMIRQRLLVGVTHERAVANYIHALNKGILKVMSKMGISTLQSYCGAQIFEAIGLDKALIDRYFTWTASRVGGIGLDVIAEEVRRRHAHAFPARPGGTPSTTSSTPTPCTSCSTPRGRSGTTSTVSTPGWSTSRTGTTPRCAACS